MSSWGDFSKLADSGMLAQFGDDHPTTLASSLHILLLLLLLAAQRRRAYYLHLSRIILSGLQARSRCDILEERGRHMPFSQQPCPSSCPGSIFSFALPFNSPAILPWPEAPIWSLPFFLPSYLPFLPSLPPSLIAFLRPLLSSHTLTRCALLSTAKCHIPSQTPLTARPRQTWLHMHACIPVYIYICRFRVPDV